MRYLRYALLLFAIALIGPGAAAVLATNGSKPATTVRKAGAPAGDFNVSDIQFALEQGDNGRPINPSNRFAFGARSIWASWSWDGAKNDQPVHYTLRFGNTDVAFGDIKTDASSGRMEIQLQRNDGDYLMIGTFRLILEPRGDNSGSSREASFEIYDNDSNSNDNNSNDNNENDNNSNSNDNNSNDNNDNNSNDNNDNNTKDNNDNNGNDNN